VPAGRLFAEVVERVAQRHIPEQIAGRLKRDFPDDPEMWVSQETIYQALYVRPRSELAKQAKEALRSGRVRRKSQGRQPQPKLKGMINIAERPAEATDRFVPGHWEGDYVTHHQGLRHQAGGSGPLRPQPPPRRCAVPAGVRRTEQLPGARACYDEQRSRGATHYQALRTLANRLVGILHGC
jgi:hypothetical protein